jgi:hypothetical protein
LTLLQGRWHALDRAISRPPAWGLFLAFLVAAQLSSGIVGHLWPKAHGVGYVIRVAMGGVIGAVLVAAALILASAVLGRRRLQP